MVSSYHVHDKHALYVKLFFSLFLFFFFFFRLIVTDRYTAEERKFLERLVRSIRFDKRDSCDLCSNGFHTSILGYLKFDSMIHIFSFRD